MATHRDIKDTDLRAILANDLKIIRKSFPLDERIKDIDWITGIRLGMDTALRRVQFARDNGLDASDYSARQFRREVLKVAHEYTEWLEQEGRGDTYSTFCDEFGYEHENRKNIYRAMQIVRQLARDIRAEEKK